MLLDTLTINLMAAEGAPQELDITVFNPNDANVNKKMANFITSLNKVSILLSILFRFNHLSGWTIY